MAAHPDWHGRIPDGDVTKFSGFADEVGAFQQYFAPKNGGCPMRGFHVKAHAGLRAELRVADAIPAAAKAGIFARARNWPAWVRVSNGFSAPMPDWFPDLVGFSVKIEGVEVETLLPGAAAAHTQDFLALNQPWIPVNNADDLMVISMATKNLLTAPFAILRGLGLRHGLFVVAWTIGWSIKRLFLRSAVTSDFFGVAPFSLGETPAKFRWVPHNRTPGSWRGGFRAFFRTDLRQRLAAGDIRFDFEVQLYLCEADTPIDGGWAWPARDTPWFKIAELVIFATDLDSPEVAADTARLDRLTFNPWHAIAAHKPLGNIQRARGLVYQRSAILRGGTED